MSWNNALLSRRALVKLAVAAGIAGPGISVSAVATKPGARRKSRIVRVVRREDTIRQLDVFGAPVSMTWAEDGRQFVGYSDGIDPARPPKFTFHSRVFTLRGDPQNATLEDLPGYPDTAWRKQTGEAQYWGGSCLALDGRIYQFLMTPNHAFLKPDTTHWPGFRFVGSKLIYSPDNGRTWNHHDGSRIVAWDRWEDRSRDNTVFFNEDPPGAFVYPVFLQMGRNYESNKDGFVYVYSVNGEAGEAAHQLVLFRVPKSRVIDRGSYEFFSGFLANGDAAWTRDTAQRRAIHTFPRRRFSSYIGEPPAGWSISSVVYNEPLGLYLMPACASASSGGTFGKPAYLGIWVASTPWGPFTLVHEETEWLPGGDPDARAMLPTISPKWISGDGRSFWLSWLDYQVKGRRGESDYPDKVANDMSRGIVDDTVLAPFKLDFWRKYVPGYQFNLQRVDLTLE